MASDDSYFSKALIGGFACAVTSACLNPFDVTKIRMQNISGYSHDYRNIFAGAGTIYREEGMRGWCRGMTPSMFREITYSSVRMGAYDPIRDSLAKLMGDDPKFTSPVVKYFSALISGGSGAAICNPFDLVKTRFQAMRPGEISPYKNMFDAMAKIVTSEGVAGLYKGWAVTCARAAILTSAQLGTYDSVKNNIFIKTFNLHEGFTLHLCSAMTASLVTTTAANPLDVVKSRFMSDLNGKYKSPFHCFAHTYKVDGFWGFFKGWTPAYFRLGPHTVFSFIIIEELRTYFGYKTL